MAEGNEVTPQDNNQGGQEELGIGLSILSFCIPLAGLIIFLVNREKAPTKANSAGRLALIGVAVGIVLRVISTVVGGS